MAAAATLIVQVLADVQNMQTNLKKGEVSLQSFARGAANIGRSMSTWISLPIAGAAVAVTKMAMDFESQMTNVYTLMDDGTIKSRNWGQAVLDMSKKTGEASGTLAKGLYDIVSSGFEAADALKVLEASTIAAKAGMTDTATSSKAVTAVLNAYSMGADEASRISDIMFGTVKYGVVTFEELSTSLGRVVGTAATANVSFEEVGAAIASMTLGGLSAEEAVIALNQVMLTFINPSKEAAELAERLDTDFSATALSTKGLNEAVKDLIDKMGISVDSIYDMEVAGNSEKQILDEMAVKAGLTSEQFAILFPNVRALKGILMLARDEGASFNEMITNVGNSVGSTEEAFSKIAETTKFKFDLALSSLKATGIEVGTLLLPYLTKLLGTVTKVADGFGNLSPELQTSIIQFAGLAAGLGIVTLAGGKIITSILTLKTTLQALNTTLAGSAFLGKFATGITGIGTAAANAAPVGAPLLLWFSDVIGLSKTAVGEFGKAINLLKGATMANWFDTTNFGANPVNGIKEGYDDISRAVQNMLKELSTSSPEIQTKALAIVEAFRQSPQNANDLAALHKGLRELDAITTVLTSTTEENTKKIMEYRFANEGLISTLQMIEGEYSTGKITTDQYNESVEYLANTNGAFKGTIVDVYSAVGVLNEEQTNAAKVAAITQGAFQSEQMTAEEIKNKIDALGKAMADGEISTTDYVNELKEFGYTLEDVEGGIDNVITGIFKLFNLNVSSEEAAESWRTELDKLIASYGVYGSSQLEIDKAQQGVNTSTDALTKAQQNYQEALNSQDPSKILDARIALREAEEAQTKSVNTLNYATSTHTTSEAAREEQIKKTVAATEEMWNEDIKIYQANELKLSQGNLTTEQQKIIADQQDEIRERFKESGVALLQYNDISKVTIDDYKIMGKEFGLTDEQITESLNSLGTEFLTFSDDSYFMGQKVTEGFWGMAGEIGLTKDNMGKTIGEVKENFVSMALEAVDQKKLTNEEFWKMAKEIGLSKEEIADIIDELNLKFKEIPPEKVTTIKVETETANSNINTFAELWSHVPNGSVKTNYVDTWFRDVYGPGGASGGIFNGIDFTGYASGGPVKDQSMKLLDGGVPTILHPPELVLNGEEAMKVIWNMATMLKAPRSEEIPASTAAPELSNANTLKPNINTDIKNVFNIAKLEVREDADIGRVAEGLYDLQENSLRGRGYR